MTSFKPYKEITLEAYISGTKKETEEETVCLSGRTILVSQTPHIKADISAARGILERLMADRTLPNTSVSEVSSVVEIVGEGGVI